MSKSSRGTPMTQIPPPGHTSHDTSYGYYAKALPVPQRLSFESGERLFGRRWLIFLPPTLTPFRPEDRFDKRRLAYSFNHANWYRSIMSQTDADHWNQTHREFETWARILEYAVNQIPNPNAVRGRPENYLDCYRFIEPTIIGVPTAAPDPDKPYDLRWSDDAHRYFYLHYQGPPGANNGQAKRRRRKV